MFRRFAPALLLAVIVAGCAGPSTLARRSEDKLAQGDLWRAWTLATRALDGAPGNARARAAAGTAGRAIADDWQRRIAALAQADSLQAAEQVLEFVDFRIKAARYTTIAVEPTWVETESALRASAARTMYRNGVTAFQARRFKKAHYCLTETVRYVPGYHDAVQLADRAYEKAVSRIAFIPFGVSSGKAGMGREIAAAWHDDLVTRLVPPDARYTQILPTEDVERVMSVSDLEQPSRESAVRIGRRAGADRVVWATVGGVDTDNRSSVFTDLIAHRVVTRDSEGHETTRWEEVPLIVFSRTRTVSVDLSYEVLAVRGSGTLTRQHTRRSLTARALWTAFIPTGPADTYALVSDVVRASNPQRAKDIEERWHNACGDGTTLQQVLEARRATRSSGRYDRSMLSRYYGVGSAFVMIEELPPVEDLAFAAAASAWKPLQADLVRLDSVDDADLGLPTSVGTDAP